MKSAQLIFGAAVLAIALVGGMRLTAEPATGTTPTFNKDVAAILFNNCVICHRPNQIAPMTLMSYKDVRPWARAIKEKILKGEMPPWRADARFGTFRNDRRLSRETIKTIIPGALLDAKTGKSVGFTGDANEAAAGEGDRSAAAASVSRRTELGTRFCCYVPGGNFQQFRSGAGKRIPTEGYIAWGMHYTPIGKPLVDRTRVGSWFQKEMTHEIVEISTGNQTHIVLGKQLVDDEL